MICRYFGSPLTLSFTEDHELMTREVEYSSYRELSTLIVSWNVDANKPDGLTGDPNNIDFLNGVLTSANSPDIISIGFQEVVDLENRKVTAKSVLLGNKTKAHDGTMSQKVSTSYKKWYDHLVLSVRLAHPGTPYHVIHSENLVGLFSCIFVKVSERASIKDTHLNVIKRGMRGNFGNKVREPTPYIDLISHPPLGCYHLSAHYRRFFLVLYQLPLSGGSASGSSAGKGCCCDLRRTCPISRTK